MAATSSKKSTDLNKLASMDVTEAIASDEVSASEKVTDKVAPITNDLVAVTPDAIDPIAIALSTHPAEHGLPAFPL